MVCYTQNLTGVTRRLQSRYSIYLSKSDWRTLEDRLIEYITSISSSLVKPKADRHETLTKLLAELKMNNPRKFRMFEDWLLQLILEFKHRISDTSGEIIPFRKIKTKKKAIERQIYT